MLMSAGVTARSQNWHLSTDTLKYPISLGEGESTMGWINHYDTVICKIKTAGSETVKSAFKVVYLYNGYRIDNPNTINLFFDEKRNKINNVDSYCIIN